MRRSVQLLLAGIICFVLTSYVSADDCKTVPGCQRSRIEGLWQYQGSPFTFIMYKSGNKASEAMGEIFVTIEYDVIWKTGCDHELVVTNVKTTENTPESVKPYLYKKGDVLQVKVHEVTATTYRYTMTWKGKNFGCTEVHKMEGSFSK